MGVNSSQLYKDPPEKELKTQLEKYAPVWKRIDKHGYFSKNYRGNPRSSPGCFVMPYNVMEHQTRLGKDSVLKDSRIWEKRWAESTSSFPTQQGRKRFP